MKKIIIAFAALAAALCLVSCNKEQIEIPSTDIKLNIKVANLDGSADTKAAKTGWVTGDKINMWLDNWNYTEQKENHTPDMIIRYTGSAWTIDSQVEGLGTRLKVSGKLTAVYEGFNDLSKYTYNWYSGHEWFDPHDSLYDGGYIPYRPMVAYTEGMDYTYADDIFSANLNSWKMETKVKILIKNDDNMMNSAANNYALQVKNTTDNTYPEISGSFLILPASNYPKVHRGISNYKGRAGGVQESDGIAFYFNSIDATNADIEFTLIESGAETNLSYTVTGKTVDPNVMTNIAINHSKFE